MKRNPVDSSSVISVGYNAGTMILEIEFVSGKVYRYFDVPNSVHANLMNAESKGRFFNAHIRDRFPFADIS